MMMKQFDHYIAIDWSQDVLAISRITQSGKVHPTKTIPTDIGDVKLYLKQLKGSKILTIEESTASQWVYVELHSYVDELIICDPMRNRLLSEGSKTDQNDAEKLAQLLKNDLLKPVFHSIHEFIQYRTLVSAYTDLVISGVRLKNQRAALLRAGGKKKTAKKADTDAASFALQSFDLQIALYEEQKKLYESKFQTLTRKHALLKRLASLPGIGIIGAVKLAAIVVDAKRFPHKGRWLSYCGLVMHDRMSGGRLYGKKRTRYSRALKSVFKTAALSVIYKTTNQNEFKDYYEYLMAEKNYPEHQARHAVARRIAVIALGVMKSERSYQKRALGQISVS